MGATDEPTNQWCLEKNPCPQSAGLWLEKHLLGKGTMILVWARAMKRDNRVLWSGRQLWSQQTGRLQGFLPAPEGLSHPWYQLETAILDKVAKRRRKTCMFTECESLTTEGILCGMRGDGFSVYGFAGRKGILEATPPQKELTTQLKKEKVHFHRPCPAKENRLAREARALIIFKKRKRKTLRILWNSMSHFSLLKL